MTGEQFLNKVRGIKLITDIHWSVDGDYFDPDEVKVVIIADGKEIEVTYPRPTESDDLIQKAAMALIINKFMEQIDNEFRTDISEELANSVNYSIKNLKGGKEMIKKLINNEDAGQVMLDEVLNMVKVDNIQDMLFISDDGIQTVSIMVEDAEGNRIDYLMRATKGYEIHGINELLRSFDLGITIEFVSFDQYEHLIDYCMNLIKTKREVTA